MFEKIGRIEFATTQSLVHLRGLGKNQEFLTCGGRFCLYSQASALGRQCVGRLRRLEATAVGSADLKQLPSAPPT
ncbi:MAG: hypothetical protein HWQ41_15280 [Nostoc sp. NOS(2021)]|nr:hypothetical protein [Nostoc sp. NOS(2021)]